MTTQTPEEEIEVLHMVTLNHTHALPNPDDYLYGSVVRCPECGRCYFRTTSGDYEIGTVRSRWHEISQRKANRIVKREAKRAARRNA